MPLLACCQLEPFDQELLKFNQHTHSLFLSFPLFFLRKMILKIVFAKCLSFWSGFNALKMEASPIRSPEILTECGTWQSGWWYNYTTYPYEKKILVHLHTNVLNMHNGDMSGVWDPVIWPHDHVGVKVCKVFAPMDCCGCGSIYGYTPLGVQLCVSFFLVHVLISTLEYGQYGKKLLEPMMTQFT